MKFKQFCCFDIESESLSLGKSRPWQIAYIHFNHKEIIKEREWYVWWEDFKISEGARRVTQFDDAKYERLAKQPVEVWNDIKRYFEDREVGVVGHNILNFDIYQLANMKRAIGVTEDWSYLERCFDTNAIAKAIKMDIRPDNNNFLAWQFKLLGERIKGKTNLTALAKEHGIVFDEAKMHDALNDIRVNVEVFHKQKYYL